ncbi:hypothetical protein P152DRAFT_457088 [Eremomyces bilateralis CBS 781.70]|uniref:PLD phosphodiesterase domain-containing protein n=1 Tax=Eremomyces bilateralis CBS 781.70 TaxID=1392243 RepID=A0A6G1G715_9PEZI|nr:uncharacterized protein P152DRAFT_457088 [Eremomyces bilateralis CBS 781.70]KAF1813726.1 hypothetical protein P152DRAFT_457088 [Eremomyces bilateralis CBS 781.70]
MNPDLSTSLPIGACSDGPDEASNLPDKGFPKDFHDIGDRASESDFPNYHIANSHSLFAYSEFHSLELGTGASIYANSLLQAFLSAKSEIILVTCFWAKSSTLTSLSETLSRLAEFRKEHLSKTPRTSEDGESPPVLRVRIHLSSLSALQKLLHPQSRAGYIFPPSQWNSKLGLPSQQVLEDGFIDLQVKSLFLLPFSVMHPKFLIIDRERAWLPSCNVSWEAWLEGCVEVKGEVISKLLQFYWEVWEVGKDGVVPPCTFPATYLRWRENPQKFEPFERMKDAEGLRNAGWIKDITSPTSTVLKPESPLQKIPTILLPSSHHRNPHFRLPFQRYHAPPPTPLNEAITKLFHLTTRSIYIQTPNLTSPPVLELIIQALQRGVDVTITTSKGMMTLEQLLTAGTTTSRCIRKLIKQYISLSSASSSSASPSQTSDALESQPPLLGRLRISYFHPNQANMTSNVPEEPVQSHLKLVIFDGVYTVLGSGNMDRASWYTSQELGILFMSEKIAGLVRSAVDGILEGRRREIFDSYEE